MVKRAISSIGKVLVRQQTEIMSIAAMLMIIGVITKIFGLLFNSLAAGYLGTDNFQDFLFASNLPELISQIILFGGISASVLPILSKVLHTEGEQRFIRVFSTLINTSLVFFVIISILIIISADSLLPWFINEIIHPKNPIGPEKIDELVSMMRVLMIPQIILGISIYVSTSLNIYERFLIPQIAPLFYNFGRIAAIFLLQPILGQSAWVLIWGTLFGAILHLLVQLPIARHIGVRYIPVWDIRDKYIQIIGTVSLPRILAISIEQIAITIDKFISFGLAGASLTFYNLAVMVIGLPLGLFGVSFATASYPTLSKAFNDNNRILASQIFLRVLNQIFFLAIPAAVLLFIMRVPVARLAFGIFGNGVQFEDTYAIAWTLLFFAPGIIFESPRMFLYRTFYAVHDTIRPLLLSLLVMVAGAITGVMFSNYFSHFNEFKINQFYFNSDFFVTKEAGIAAVGGLALSSSIVFTLEGIILIYWLNKKYLHISWQDLILPIVKKLFAGFIMLLASYFIYKIWAGLETTKYTIFLIILTFTTTSASFMIYIGMCWLLKVDEVKVYVRFLNKYPNIKVFRQTFNRFKNFSSIVDEESNPTSR